MSNKNSYENPFLANPNAIIDLIKMQANEPYEVVKTSDVKPAVKQKAIGSYSGNKTKGVRRHG